jgi:beta-1,4-mannosyltransferase
MITYDGSSLHELVKDGVNGLTFSDAAELAEQIEVRLSQTLEEYRLTLSQELLTSFPESPKLKSLASSIQTPSHTHLHSPTAKAAVEDISDQWMWTDWEDNWGRVMRGLILRDVNL